MPDLAPQLSGAPMFFFTVGALNPANFKTVRLQSGVGQYSKDDVTIRLHKVLGVRAPEKKVVVALQASNITDTGAIPDKLEAELVSCIWRLHPQLDYVVLRDLILQWEEDGDVEYSLLPATLSSLRCDHAMAQALMMDMLQASAFGDRGKRYDAQSLDAESAMALTELSRGGLVEGSMHAGFTITPEGLADMMCKNVLHAPK